MDTLVRVLIIINALSASVIFGIAVARGRSLYDVFSQREKVYHNCLVLYSFAAAFSSVANYLQESVDEVSPFIFIVVNLYALRAFIQYHGEIFNKR